jgi:two-component system cell cycle sensor histidine kinase/response regulator CckA
MSLTKPPLACCWESAPSPIQTILLAEDDNSVRRFMREMLEYLGYHVLDTADPIEATELARAFRGPIHLLITDIALPGMSGAELAQRIIGTRPETKMLFVSGHSAQTLARDGLLRSDVFFLKKPFTWNSLAAKIRETLNHPQ